LLIEIGKAPVADSVKFFLAVLRHCGWVRGVHKLTLIPIKAFWALGHEDAVVEAGMVDGKVLQAASDAFQGGSDAQKGSDVLE